MLEKHNAQDFCLSFPDSEDTHISLLRMKCDEIGIISKENDSRPMYYYSPNDDKCVPVVTERELKNWINSHGTSVFIEDENSEEYKNWELLLLSEHPENLIIAIMSLNMSYRPEPKFFSLLLLLGLFHRMPKVQEMAEMIVMPYIELEKWKKMKNEGEIRLMRGYLKNIDSQLNNYYDLNYLHIWSNILPNFSLSSRNILHVSSKNLHLIKNNETLKSIFSHISQIEFRLEDGDSLDNFIYLAKQALNTKSIKIYSDKEYQLDVGELPVLNKRFLVLKNLVFSDSISLLPILDKVEYLEWNFENEINFSPSIFPSLRKLELSGTRSEAIDFKEVGKELEELTLCITEQTVLPNWVYNCKTLKVLGIYHSNITSISPRIKELKKLITINVEGSEFEEFPIEFFLEQKRNSLLNIHPPKSNDYRIDVYKELGRINKIGWAAESIKTFPYKLSTLNNLRNMDFGHNQMSEIDERIAGFSSLEELSFRHNELETIPEKLKLLPKLIILNLEYNNITELSFTWINHINKKGIWLNLTFNPLHTLPIIPIELQQLNITENRGRIILTKNSLPSFLVDKYRKVFGEEFIREY